MRPPDGRRWRVEGRKGGRRRQRQRGARQGGWGSPGGVRRRRVRPQPGTPGAWHGCRVRLDVTVQRGSPHPPALGSQPQQFPLAGRLEPFFGCDLGRVDAGFQHQVTDSAATLFGWQRAGRAGARAFGLSGRPVVDRGGPTRRGDASHRAALRGARPAVRGDGGSRRPPATPQGAAAHARSESLAGFAGLPTGYGSGGWEFESLRARQISPRYAGHCREIGGRLGSGLPVQRDMDRTCGPKCRASHHATAAARGHQAEDWSANTRRRRLWAGWPAVRDPIRQPTPLTDRVSSGAPPGSGRQVAIIGGSGALWQCSARD